MGLFESVTPAAALAWGQWLGLQWWAPLAFILVYTPASLVLFPRWAITLAAVAAFGPWAAFALAEAGVVLAAVIGFLAGRVVDERSVSGPRLHAVGGLLRRGGLVAVTIVRLVPIAPFMVVNAAMGALRVRIHHFVLGTFLGMLPGMLAATVLGDQVVTALADPSRVSPWMVAAAVGLLLLVAAAGRQIAKGLKGG
jgi:uncharacterized membrane protein YdjX (TVP38/TMEM64 family)